MKNTLKKIFLLKEDDALTMFNWKPKLGTNFILVDRESGEISEFHHDLATFTFHGINAFENDDGSICVDLMCYDEPGYAKLSLDNLRHPEQFDQGEVLNNPQVKRFTLDFVSHKVTEKVVYDGSCELCTINYDRFNTKSDYKFVYGVTNEKGEYHRGKSSNMLLKLNMENSDVVIFGEGEDFSFGEPIFVENPECRSVDDGVVLSVVFDSVNQCSFLLVLDAVSFTEIARYKVPHVVPAGLHGMFLA